MEMDFRSTWGSQNVTQIHWLHSPRAGPNDSVSGEMGTPIKKRKKCEKEHSNAGKKSRHWLPPIKVNGLIALRAVSLFSSEIRHLSIVSFSCRNWVNRIYCGLYSSMWPTFSRVDQLSLLAISKSCTVLFWDLLNLIVFEILFLKLSLPYFQCFLSWVSMTTHAILK